MKNRKSIIVFLLILVTLFTSCTYGSYSIISGSIDMGKDEISGSYSKFNGYKQKKYDFNKGDEIVLNTEIKTESGDLSILIIDENDDIIHEIKESGQNSLPIGDSGEYNIRVSGQDHKGEFNIKLNTNN
jgi:hypothetical protein